ncbi:T9SS type A sorting domain-containing protein [Gramella lutea]|uniref:T9SS type A sorting domain-containing protein n=1 Tax=Christiangramia lutea TaxID=1607951 RepID=A0A9X2A941_9FLAO|nr:T9SS type A sorting domain-containing protein [Christiangramia lutea]MCH4823000.1 T9SS type A sorting domain-containing protein [Christiangramia lutea]
MKKTFKILTLALFLLVSLNSRANDGIDLKVGDQQYLLVSLSKVEKGALLSLLGENKEIIYKDRILEEDSITRKFDFNGLPDGEYTLKLDREFHISTSVITKIKDKLIINYRSNLLIFKPLYRGDEDQVSVYLANPEKNRVEIKIFDKFGVPVGILTCNDLVIKKKLDFSEVPPGNYTVQIKTKTNNFTKTLVVG